MSLAIYRRGNLYELGAPVDKPGRKIVSGHTLLLIFVNKTELNGQRIIQPTRTVGDVLGK